MAGADGHGVPSLAAEKRQLTERRIRRAAMEVMALRGFSATVDEIADSAGVSSRTIYRYFATHDQLIAAGIEEGLQAAGQPIPGSPSVGDDFDGWLERIALEAHTKNATVVGAAFWDVLGPAPSESKEIEAARALRRPDQDEVDEPTLGHRVDRRRRSGRSAAGGGDELRTGALGVHLSRLGR